MASRKRTFSQRAKTLEIDRKDEAEDEEGRLTLVLKSSSSSQTETALSLLETCLEIPEDEVIENLLQSSQLLLCRLTEDWKKGFELIKRLWLKYNSNFVICSVIVNMLIQFVPDIPMVSLQELDFIISIFENDSKEVQSLILKLWSLIGDAFTSELKTKCIEKAVNVIYDPCYMLRMECLNLIGCLNHDTVSQESLLSLVAEFSNDTDPRVRRASIRSLLLLLQKGVQVELSVYHKSCDLLQDDDDSVRKNALQLVFCLGVKLQESGIMVPLVQDPNMTLPIEDDCFIKTCDMVTDRSIAVRSLAASLLGQFKNVSERFLLQTLDKKLMSHLKVVKSEHQRAREVASGSRDWDTGQRWGGGAPRLDLDPTELTLLRSGSCGAFVHSLEDEFLEVRSTAVVSMGHLCMISSVFGSLSLDYLVDMFNDEIENVRLLAINCLRKVSATIHFREDQLETVLGVLQESSQEIREALHDLLGTCHITTTSGLRITVYSLLDNLKKYSTDCQSIWSCMKYLGSRHAHLVCSLVPELLSSHPYFLTKEPDINDAAYVSILILVFNATGLSPTMISLFPSHIFHHYTYLHDTLPLLIPSVKVLTASQRSKLPEMKTSSPEVFMEQILSRVRKPMLESPDQNVAMVTLKQCIKDLNQFSKVEPSLSGCVRFSSQFLQCRLLLIKIQKAVSCAVMATAGPNETAADIRELLLLSYRLQWTYTGHDSRLLLTLHLLRVVGHCALLAFAIKLDWPIDHRDKFEQLRSGLYLRVENLTKFCDDNSLSLPVLIQPLITRIVHTDANQLLPLLQSAVHDCVFYRLDSTQLIKIRQCWANITDPDHSDDIVHKFLSSLALALPMKAVISNLVDISSLAAKVRLPDGRSIVSIPKGTELRPTDKDTLKLNMKIILSHGNWTDSSSLLIQLVKYYKPDTPTDSKCLEILNKLCRKGGVSRVPAVDCAGDRIGEVVISDSVRVQMHPQESLTRAFNVFGPI